MLEGRGLTEFHQTPLLTTPLREKSIGLKCQTKFTLETITLFGLTSDCYKLTLPFTGEDMEIVKDLFKIFLIYAVFFAVCIWSDVEWVFSLYMLLLFKLVYEVYKSR